MDCFDVFIIVYCLVVHRHDDPLVTTSQLLYTLTNTHKQHIFNFLFEINVFL